MLHVVLKWVAPMHNKIISCIFTFYFFTFLLLSPVKAIAHATLTEQEHPPLAITPIANNVFQHISYKHVQGYGLVPASGLIVINDKDAHIIDTPWTIADTKKLVSWIAEQGLTLKGTISTHFHDDRAAGIPYLNSLSVETYAYELTNKLLKANNKQAAKHSLLSKNSQTKQQSYIDQSIEVFYPGAGHSSDNIVVWLPEHQLLFGGCLVKSLNSKTLGYTGDADIEQWPRSIQKLITRYPNVQRVVPGHGQVGDVKLLLHTQNLAMAAKK